MATYKLRYNLTWGVVLFLGYHCWAQEVKGTFTEKYRPQYHFSLPKGWINDPTGMIYYKDWYYLNYGTGKTKDFVHWEFGMPKFQKQEGIGMMSGSAVVDYNNTSGFGTKSNPPIVAIYSELRHSDIMQFQSVAYSLDGGNTFTAYDKNPVIDINNTEFRDPQVFWHEPTKKWIMAVALAEATKVRLYGSTDLKEWTFLSDFGPYGARGGVWECPDLFPLAVNGDPRHIKWVMQVGVQPVNGQYFVGDFDGTSFTIDPAYEKQVAYKKYMPSGIVVFDFENGLSGWEIDGDAFASSPAQGHLENQGAILNKEGNSIINTFHNRDAGTGRALSPEFTISDAFLNFLIGGGNRPGKESINLIINGKTVRSSTGKNTETLTWTGWDVNEFKDKKARIEIVDNFAGDFGHILADHFMLGGSLAENQLEVAPWIDYGPDFYAVRSWSNMKPGDDRRVWIAWMSNWLYAHEVPTTPFKGIQSLPRSLALDYKDGRYTLLQQPVQELTALREKHKQAKGVKAAPGKAVPLPSPSRNNYELQATIEPGGSAKAGFNLCVGKSQKAVVYFDAKTNELVFDRTQSGATGFSTSFPGVYRAPLVAKGKQISLQIFVDACSVEIFANGGATTLSALIFPDAEGTGIEFFSEGGSAVLSSLDLWELRSVWK
ncbi:levanase precursor [Flavobacterium sp. Sd200]|uniref:glycoside hydrolase family 32 protein n=1 Tax=Flavobacterium sp. Sd200 TaxID=2692211 RepID=UPI00137090CB|nr:glycoside hydrolase family 32 protein [Flavobacterium sp. Sd200]MXN91672.1 levanase precursor [Flavobacterium sp. Sd200]